MASVEQHMVLLDGQGHALAKTNTSMGATLQYAQPVTSSLLYATSVPAAIAAAQSGATLPRCSIRSAC